MVEEKLRSLVRDRSTLAWGLLSIGIAVVVMVFLLPWLNADPPRGLSWSGAPYTDEGLYNVPARNAVLFGRFGTTDFDLTLTDGSYAAAGRMILAIGGVHLGLMRFVSVVCIAAAVAVCVAGLRRPLGPAAAVLTGVALGSTQLLLLYARMAIVEPFVIFWLVCAFVAMTRVTPRTAWRTGLLVGTFLAVATSAKLSGVLAIPAILGVPALHALVARDWRRLVAPAVAAGWFGGLALVWYVAVLRPNARLFHLAFATLNGVKGKRPRGIPGVIARLLTYAVKGSDHAVPWTAPVTLASLAGIVALAVTWRRVSPAVRVAALTGLTWAASWLVLALSPYAPNRYILVVVPGLAILAGATLGGATEAVLPRNHGRGGQTLMAATALLAVVIATPGLLGYVRSERTVFGTVSLARAQQTVAAALPRNAVVFGVFAPMLVFPTKAKTVVPWDTPPINLDDPIGRYHVTDVVVDDQHRTSPSYRGVLAHGGAGGGPLTERDAVARVTWGPYRITVYRIPSSGRPPTGRLRPTGQTGQVQSLNSLR